MSDMTTELAEQLARDVIAYVDKTDNQEIVQEMTKILTDRSQTLEEAFTTTIRVIRAERAARQFLTTRPDY